MFCTFMDPNDPIVHMVVCSEGHQVQQLLATLSLKGPSFATNKQSTSHLTSVCAITTIPLYEKNLKLLHFLAVVVQLLFWIMRPTK